MVTQRAKNGAYVVVLEFSGVFGTVVDLWVRREEGGDRGRREEQLRAVDVCMLSA